MAKCPKCRRETYIAKWDQCPACGYGQEAGDRNVTRNAPVTERRDAGARGTLVPGQPCPLCGKRVGRSNAERQRAWREKARDRNAQRSASG